MSGQRWETGSFPYGAATPAAVTPPAVTAGGGRSGGPAAWGAAGWLGALALLTSIPVMVAWLLLAPRAVWVVRGGGGYLKDGNTEAFVAADSYFAFLGIAVGGLLAALAFRWVRRHGPVVAAGVCLGSILGSAAAAGLGHVLSVSTFAGHALTAGDGRTVAYFLTLRSLGVVAAWPLAGQLTLLLLSLAMWPREPAPVLPGQQPWPQVAASGPSHYPHTAAPD